MSFFLWLSFPSIHTSCQIGGVIITVEHFDNLIELYISSGVQSDMIGRLEKKHCIKCGLFFLLVMVDLCHVICDDWTGVTLSVDSISCHVLSLHFVYSLFFPHLQNPSHFLIDNSVIMRREVASLLNIVLKVSCNPVCEFTLCPSSPSQLLAPLLGSW